MFWKRDIRRNACQLHRFFGWDEIRVNFTTPWLWLSSNDLVSEITGKRLQDSVFDIGGGRPKVGPVSLKGKGFEFNFSKFWTFTRTRFHVKETEKEIFWHEKQRTLCNRMVTNVRCKKYGEYDKETPYQ